MKMVKSLMLGTAAGFVAMTGAQAADLPVKAKAVEYVKICSLYGAGFYYIPGTDTCIRIGGALRLDTAFNGGTYDAPFWQGSTGGANAYNRSYFNDRERLNLFIDTRTATEYGVVRTYANLQFDFVAASSRENIAGGFIENDFLFIQFAGFTFGKAVSMFDPQWALAKPTISSGFFAGSNNATGIPMLAYTAQFGNGVSGTISIEDAQPYRTAGIANTNAPFTGPFASLAGLTGYGGAAGVNTFTGNASGGDHTPDIVGNIRLDQAWGSLHFGAAAHENHGTYYTTALSTLALSDNGHPSSAWGYAVTGAFELKNLPTGVGDSFKAEATWGKGAAKYTFGGTVDTNGSGHFGKLGGGTGSGGSMGFGYVLDGVYGNGGSINLATTWDVSAFYEHYWNPAWRTSVFGSYSSINYGSAGNALLTAMANGPAAIFGTGTFGGTNTGNFNMVLSQIGTKTAWTPVANLTLSAEFTYSRLHQNQNGTFTTSAAGTPSGVAAGTTYQMKDQSLYNGAVQIIRSF